MAITERDPFSNKHTERCASTECPCYMDAVAVGVGQAGDDAEKITELERAGNEMATWLDYYANVHKESSIGNYVKLARKAIHDWERLVPPKEDD